MTVDSNEHLDFSKDAILLTAARHYRNRRTSYHEFRKDLKRAGRINVLLSRRSSKLDPDFPEQLDKLNRIILNRVIVFFNLFSIDFAKHYLFHCIDEKYHPTLKTILLFLSFIKETEFVDTSLDIHMIKFLREKV